MEIKVNEVEVLRQLLYATVQNNGLNCPETVRISQLLDDKLNDFLYFINK
ncbi:aspartyl-phosphate phosphatase Spo0E family protein [Alkalihalobacterium elongatum]|nr:aspartyl-phosphate phosphatase Spo0E family protein [Alkalihalobacterium elongatum]